MSIDDIVSDHYNHGSLAQAVLAAVGRVVADPENIAAADLAPVDEFHIGGRPATVRFAGQLDLAEGMHVLDVGSGIGGPARYMAESAGCRVTGVDLMAEYCQVATLLTGKVGLADKVAFEVGNACEMAFEAASFDAAYTIHVAMNIPDKAALYDEVARVVKPGATFGVYDILAGPSGAQPRYPVPWATTEAASFLATIEEMRAMLDTAGFDIVAEADRTEFAVEFFAKLSKQAKGGPPPLGLHIVMGEDFATKIGNMVGNVADGHIAPWEIICRKR